MKISIALAAFNGADHLQKQLDSYVEQTLRPDELVVVDDCSIDGTLDIVRAFSERAPFPVRLSHNSENVGYAQNFGKALSLCNGDLVFLSDQDDVWFPEKLERIADLALKEPHMMLILNDAELADSSLHPLGFTKLQQIRSAGLTDDYFLMGCCAAIRRPLLDILLPIPDFITAHDRWISICAKGFGLKKVNEEVLQYYRQHDTNVSNFYVNRLTRVSRLTSFWQRCINIVQQIHLENGFSVEFDEKTALLQRIQNKHAECCEIAGPSIVYAFKESLIREIEILGARRKLRSQKRLLRLCGVFHLWKRGGYKEVSGVFSAIKDLIL